MKHELEFKPTLDILSKLRIAIDREIIETRIPIKKLIEKATNRKQIYIDVNDFIPPTDNSQCEKVGKELNTSKIQFHQIIGVTCELEMKFNSKIELLVIDILYIIYSLGMSSRTNRILVDIKTKHLHSKTSCIRFKMA